MSKHIWGYWDCQCGHTHIRGDVTECPGCGSPRLADTKFLCGYIGQRVCRGFPEKFKPKLDLQLL